MGIRFPLKSQVKPVLSELVERGVSFKVRNDEDGCVSVNVLHRDWNVLKEISNF